MKWWQNNFDVITILIIWRQIWFQEESEETMAVEVVTDGKNDKTENNV